MESAGGQLGVFPPTDFAPLRESWKALKSFGPENSGACKVSRGLTILGDRAREGLSPGTLDRARTHEGFSESGFKVGTFPKMTPSQCQPDRIPTGQRHPSPPSVGGRVNHAARSSDASLQPEAKTTAELALVRSKS